jgi:putative ABC transport system permease protein
VTRLNLEELRAAAETLVRYPARSALTLLGLAIGVAAFIAMVSFGQGARRSVIAQFNRLGTNMVMVSTATTARESQNKPVQPLMPSDVQALRRESTAIAQVIPVIRDEQNVVRGAAHHVTRVAGTEPGFFALHGWPAMAGGTFDGDDLARRAKVCVLGQTPARLLFGAEDPVGQVVVASGVLPCRVVGVLEMKGFTAGGEDLDDQIFVPLTTFQSYLAKKAGYSWLELEPLRPELMDVARVEAAAIMTRTHRVENDDPDFRVTSPIEVVQAVEETSAILSDLLRGIAAVSLLVGGIGIMNIQLVSVAERTKEIGIRAAIGAAPKQILSQFLWEAVTLTVVGAAAGVVLGLAVATVTAWLMSWPRVISGAGIAGAVAFALAVGLAFGILPAQRAAALDPIEALRHE